MKTRKLSSIVKMLILVTGVTMFVSSCGDKTTGKFNGHETQSIPESTSVSNCHECVDLGLPSGTKWATMNVGANSPEDYGDYFAWGETSPKSSYDRSNLKYCLDDSGYKFSKYVTDSDYGTLDGRNQLGVDDDAAYVNWGSDWRMPSKEQLDELRKKCKWTWTSQGGHNGYKVVGPNGSSIFLPAAGSCYKSNIPYADGESGLYWSISLFTDRPCDACYLLFGREGKFTDNDSRCCGRSVRPVKRPEIPVRDV